MDRDDPAYRGQSEYSRLVLKLHDPLVLGFAARFVWRCPTTRLVEGYRQHIRDRHLDVGPGTGYFLEQSGLPDGSRVTILDPNANVLDHASRRLRHLEVTAVEADVLKPLPVDGPFDSAALHLVIHCLRTTPAQDRGGSQRGGRPRTDWRALRRIGPRDLRTPHVAILDGSGRKRLGARFASPTSPGFEPEITHIATDER